MPLLPPRFMPLLPPRLSASRHSHLYLRCSWRRDPTTPPAVVPSRRLPPLPRGSPQTTAADSSGPAAAPPRPRTATRPAAAVAASATDRARLRRWPRPCPASCVQPPTSCDGIGCPTPASACLPFALPHSVPCAPGLLPGHPLRLVSSSGGRQDRSVTSAIGEIFLFCRLLSLSRPASPRAPTYHVARADVPRSPASFLHQPQHLVLQGLAPLLGWRSGRTRYEPTSIGTRRAGLPPKSLFGAS